MHLLDKKTELLAIKASGTYTYHFYFNYSANYSVRNCSRVCEFTSRKET
jgi:hypothetical protein